MTYAGEVTYGDISVSRSHCPSHTVVSLLNGECKRAWRG